MDSETVRGGKAVFIYSLLRPSTRATPPKRTSLGQRHQRYVKLHRFLEDAVVSTGCQGVPPGGLFYGQDHTKGAKNMKGRKSVLVEIFSVISVLGWAISAHPLPVPIESSLEMEAMANAGGETVTDTDSDVQDGTINPLSILVSAPAISGSASVLTTGAGSAIWDGPGKGHVQLFGIGWVTKDVSSGFAAVFTGTDWIYTFIADKDGFFILKFTVTGAGSDTFGLNGFNFIWSGPGGNDFMPLESSGTITRPITAGDTFTVNIKNQANIFGGLGTRDARMKGTFEWSTTGRDDIAERTSHAPDPAPARRP
jgi:hypothetical protein